MAASDTRERMIRPTSWMSDSTSESATGSDALSLRSPAVIVVTSDSVGNGPTRPR